jgi:hypothetical protein
VEVQQKLEVAVVECSEGEQEGLEQVMAASVLVFQAELGLLG